MLTTLAIRDVVLIERDELTAGSTWHAAGLVGQLRTSANITRLLGYSVHPPFMGMVDSMHPKRALQQDD